MTALAAHVYRGSPWPPLPTVGPHSTAPFLFAAAGRAASPRRAPGGVAGPAALLVGRGGADQSPTPTTRRSPDAA